MKTSTTRIDAFAALKASGGKDSLAGKKRSATAPLPGRHSAHRPFDSSSRSTISNLTPEQLYLLHAIPVKPKGRFNYDKIRNESEVDMWIDRALRIHLNQSCAVWALYQSLPRDRVTGKPSKNLATQLIKSRGYTNFSRPVLQRMEKAVEKNKVIGACDAAVAGDAVSASPGAAVPSKVASGAPLFTKVPRGRKPNPQFELDVIAKLMYITVVSTRDQMKRKVTPLAAGDKRTRNTVKAEEKGQYKV